MLCALELPDVAQHRLAGANYTQTPDLAVLMTVQGAVSRDSFSIRILV